MQAGYPPVSRDWRKGPPITSCRSTRGMKGPRLRRNTCWRRSLLASIGTVRWSGVPVLAALHAIEWGLVSEGQRVGVVCQDRHGLAVQTLRIRSARGVLAPERREAATQVPCDGGYENLVRAARIAAIGADDFTARTAHRAVARSVGKAALGMECQPEILRVQNGDWEILDLSGYDPATTEKGPRDGLSLHGCDVVLFETLTEGKLKDRLFGYVQGRHQHPSRLCPQMPWHREHCRRHRRAGNGAPIFFDFLPRLSTIVHGPGGATNFDLIRPDEILEAGRTYRSPEPASLAIPAGQRSVSVYLRKEAAMLARKATVEIGAPLNETEAVSLWVEQKPAAGRAKILMEAPGLGRNFTVDWDEAQQDDRSWDQIIESLETSVSIPKRLVLPCGMHAWEDSERADGLLSLLQTEPQRRITDWDTLATKLAQRPFGQYCISSDGDLPTAVKPEDIERLDMLTDKALDINRRRLRGEQGPGTEDNAALKFLTWQFHRCPPEVATWLMDCVETAGRASSFRATSGELGLGLSGTGAGRAR